MTTQKNDRRNMKTRAAIHMAFMELLEKKKYRDITIQEIFDHANIGRATFYTHYETKDSLLIEFQSSVFDNFINSITPQNEKYIIPIATVFTHLSENHACVIRNFFSEKSFEEIVEKQATAVIEKTLLKRGLAEKSENAIPIGLLASHYYSTCIMLLKWWIGNNFNPSPQTMEQYWIKLITNPPQA